MGRQLTEIAPRPDTKLERAGVLTGTVLRTIATGDSASI